MLYTQPQSGPYHVDQGSEFLKGGTLLALVVGANRGINLANGAATVISGTVPAKATRTGLGAYNSGASGDVGIAGTNIGGSLYVDFWHGYYFSGGPVSAYLFGDYNGSAGSGLAGRHNNVGGNWGWFNGTTVANGSEALVSGNLYTFVIVRDAISGLVKIYRDGILKVTDAAPPNGPMAFGSIGQGQYATFGCESSTLLAGRIRFKSWTPQQVLEFSRNPWQLFLDHDEEDEAAFFAPAVGGIPTGAYGATLDSITLSASGAVTNTGMFAATLAAATMSATGAAGAAPTGSYAATLDGVTMMAAGAQLNAGSFASVLQGTAMASIGTAAPHVTGTFAAALASTTMAAAGFTGDTPPAATALSYRWRIMRRGFST